MEFLRSFLIRHLAGKPVVASPNVGCFLRLLFHRLQATIKECHNSLEHYPCSPLSQFSVGLHAGELDVCTFPHSKLHVQNGQSFFTAEFTSLKISGSLSKDVLQPRTSTGSGRFTFLGSGFAQILWQIVFISIRKLSNINLEASSHIKREKASLPVDERCSSPLFFA